MGKVITITNQKGGVGKTTTTQVFAAGLSERGCKVLVIDLDPQMNLTSISDKEGSSPTIYNLFKGEIEDTKNVILSTELGYDIIPGSLELAAADMEFSSINREFLLKNIIKTVKEEYDYILVDTQPALGILSLNALVAANEVIIPITPSKLASEGFIQLYKTIIAVSDYHNPNITIKGILITMYKSTKVQMKYIEVLETIAKELNINIFESKIRVSTAVEEFQDKTKNVLLSKNKKNKNIINDFEAFIGEYLDK